MNSNISSQSVLKIGKPLVLDVSDPKVAGTYKSSIFDIDENKKIITIGMPSYKAQYIPIPSGTRIYVKMMSETSMYVFQSVVISYEKDTDGFYVTYITMPDKMRKIQRRRFLRVSFYQEGTFLRIGDDKEYSFITKDLSAGGCMIVTEVKMNLSEIIKISLKVSEEIVFKEKIVKIMRVQNQVSTQTVQYGLKFEELTRGLENRLVRFVFRIEQEKRRKEKKEVE